MKNKNIMLGLGLGILANLNNNTKKRSHEEEDGEDGLKDPVVNFENIYEDDIMIKRLIKSIDNDDIYNYQLKIKAPKSWKGTNTTSIPEEIKSVNDDNNKEVEVIFEILNQESVLLKSIKVNEFSCDFNGTWGDIKSNDFIDINLFNVKGEFDNGSEFQFSGIAFFLLVGNIGNRNNIEIRFKNNQNLLALRPPPVSPKNQNPFKLRPPLNSNRPPLNSNSPPVFDRIKFFYDLSFLVIEILQDPVKNKPEIKLALIILIKKYPNFKSILLRVIEDQKPLLDKLDSLLSE